MAKIQSTIVPYSEEELASESWRPVVGFEAFYSVSNIGRVLRKAGKGCRQDRILKPGQGTYLLVILSVSGTHTTRSVHSLVADAFLGPCPDGQEVNHKDGNKYNPRPTNLEYVTRSGNRLHAMDVIKTHPTGEQCSFSKLTEAQVIQIRTRYAAGGVSVATLGSEFNTTPTNIQQIVTGQWWQRAGGPTHKPKPKTKLTPALAAEIRQLCEAGVPQKQIAERFNVSVPTVSMIKTGKIW